MTELIRYFKDTEHAKAFWQKNCRACKKLKKCSNAASIETVLNIDYEKAPYPSEPQWMKIICRSRKFRVTEHDKVGYCEIGSGRDKGVRPDKAFFKID